MYVNESIFKYLKKQNILNDDELHTLSIPYLIRIIDIVRNASINNNIGDAIRIIELFLNSRFYLEFINVQHYQIRELKSKYFFFYLIEKRYYYAIKLVEKTYRRFKQLLCKAKKL